MFPQPQSIIPTSIKQRAFAILQALARYHVLNRAQIQELCFAHYQQEKHARRKARGWLQTLHDQKLIHRHNAEVYYPRSGGPGPVYFLAPRGVRVLAEELEDDRYLNLPTDLPQSNHRYHFLAVSDTHIMLDRAVAAQQEVSLLRWINEYEPVNLEESDTEKHFCLHTKLRDKPFLYCAPDAGFILQYLNHRAVYYLEQDRATSGTKQVAHRKMPGYLELFKRQHHRKHFPETTFEKFNVLLVCPNPKRRDALRREMRKHEGHELWKFISVTDLTPDRILFDSTLFPAVAGDPVPLVRRVEVSNNGSPKID